MADALCGPTNALSSFQKHSQVDRSLQQDRLTNRQQQHENFRSSPGPSNAFADAEFDAFQNGHTAPLHHLASGPPPTLQHAATAPPQTSLGLPGWAADFQQLNIHEARRSPIPAVRFRQEAPLQRPSGSNWHAEFLRQDGKTATPPPLASAATFGPGFAQQSFMGGLGGMGAFGTQYGYGTHAQRQQMARQPDDMFDDAAFAAAFDNAAALISQPSQEQQNKGKGKEQETKQPETEQEQFSLDHACVEPPEPFFADVDEEQLTNMTFNQQQEEPYLSEYAATMPKGAEAVGEQIQQGIEEQFVTQDRLLDSSRQMPFEDHMEGLEDQQPLPEEQLDEQKLQEEERMDPDLEADELSRTAGQLLDNLKHEQGEKFANSNFMALMRQLRDREVRVEGDNFVEVSEHDAHHTHQQPILQHGQEPDLGSRGELSPSDWA